MFGRRVVFEGVDINLRGVLTVSRRYYRYDSTRKGLHTRNPFLVESSNPYLIEVFVLLINDTRQVKK